MLPRNGSVVRLELTKREAQVYALSLDPLHGRSEHKMASYLQISVDTVHRHLLAARQKVEIQRAEKGDDAPILAIEPCRVCGGQSSPCRKCIGAKCRTCHQPIYRDECYTPAAKPYHLRCQNGRMPRPDHMPDPARHSFLPAQDEAR